MRSQTALSPRDSWIALGLALGTAVACSRAPSTSVSQNSTPGDAPDLFLKGVAFVRMVDGQVTARGLSQTLEYRRAGGRVHATAATSDLEPAAGALASLGRSTVQAPDVVGETGARHAVATGGVRFQAARGDRGTADAAEYDGANGQLRSSTPVWLQGPGYEVRGRSFAARTDGSRIDVKGDVRGAVQVGEER